MVGSLKGLMDRFLLAMSRLVELEHAAPAVVPNICTRHPPSALMARSVFGVFHDVKGHIAGEDFSSPEGELRWIGDWRPESRVDAQHDICDRAHLFCDHHLVNHTLDLVHPCERGITRVH